MCKYLFSLKKKIVQHLGSQSLNGLLVKLCLTQWTLALLHQVLQVPELQKGESNHSNLSGLTLLSMVNVFLLQDQILVFFLALLNVEVKRVASRIALLSSYLL